MKTNSTNGGYVGLVMILVITVIIAFVVWRADLLGVKKSNGKSVNTTVQDLKAIEQAKQLKDKLEKRDKQFLTE